MQLRARCSSNTCRGTRTDLRSRISPIAIADIAG
jgi:hypothetical protein